MNAWNISLLHVGNPYITPLASIIYDRCPLLSIVVHFMNFNFHWASVVFKSQVFQYIKFLGPFPAYGIKWDVAQPNADEPDTLWEENYFSAISI